MSLAQAARALDGEVSGDQILCPGPGHSARDRSLSVKFDADAPDGFLVNCFAAGDALEAKDHVRQRLGLTEFQPRANGRDEAVRFDYRDPETGDIRYSKLRLERRGSRDKRIWFDPKKRGGGEPLLYGGERLAKHPKDKVVFIVEGENKVDRLAQFGAVAVSCDTGAESNWLPSHAEQLRGRPIVLWPDSDEAGENYVRNAAAAIRSSHPQADIRIVRPFGLPNGKKGKDVCDWNGDKVALAELVRAAQPYADAASAPDSDRTALHIAAILDRDIPPRDFLLGQVICTTSRWLVSGETGVGKTLFALELAAAVASGADFLGWQGRRRARVLYLDGELPAETVKERLQLIERRYGREIELFVYSRDLLRDDDMPALNTQAGGAWLLREIEAQKPDLIVLDSIMCLTVGKLTDEESWTPVKELVRQISSRRVAQIWLHHTGHDAARSYGTKTREWEMDTTVMLSRITDEESGGESGAAFQLEFHKKRLCTPHNFEQFKPKTIRRDEEGFTFQEGVAAKAAQKGGRTTILVKAFLDAFGRLIDGAPQSIGFDGKPVRKVKVDGIREDMKRRGHLEVDEKGHVVGRDREAFRAAKAMLIAPGSGKFVEEDGLIWRIRP